MRLEIKFEVATYERITHDTSKWMETQHIQGQSFSQIPKLLA